MDKNMYFAGEADKADNSSKQDSDGELFVNRVAKSGVVLKFKVGKYGKHSSSSNVLSHGELKFSEKLNTRAELANFEANTHMLSEQSGITNAEPRNNKNAFLDSTMGTDPHEEVGRAEMVNNSSKKDGQMMSVKSVAMDTCMAGSNGTNSSPNAKIFSRENVIKRICLTGNHEASASEKNCSSPSEEHRCHQCGKQFQIIDSLHGHMGCHRRDEYKLIRTILEQTFVIEKPELKSIWKASQALLKMSTVCGWGPVHNNTKAVNLTGSSKDISGVTTQMMEDISGVRTHIIEDISGVTTQMMEAADVLIKLSQKVCEDVATTQSQTSVGIFKCTTCNKIFGSYQALGGHISSHNKQPRPRQSLDTAGSSCGNSEWQSWKYFCNKCNEKFPTGQSLGGHKRKHFFEEQHRTRPVTDGNVNLRVPKPYDTVQPLQTKNQINVTQSELAPFEMIGAVERCILDLKNLSLEDNIGEP